MEMLYIEKRFRGWAFMGKFGFVIEAGIFYRVGPSSSEEFLSYTPDPSLRLKYGCAQDDADAVNNGRELVFRALRGM